MQRASSYLAQIAAQPAAQAPILRPPRRLWQQRDAVDADGLFAESADHAALPASSGGRRTVGGDRQSMAVEMPVDVDIEITPPRESGGRSLQSPPLRAAEPATAPMALRGGDHLPQRGLQAVAPPLPAAHARDSRPLAPQAAGTKSVPTEFVPMEARSELPSPSSVPVRPATRMESIAPMLPPKDSLTQDGLTQESLTEEATALRVVTRIVTPEESGIVAAQKQGDVSPAEPSAPILLVQPSGPLPHIAPTRPALATPQAAKVFASADTAPQAREFQPQMLSGMDSISQEHEVQPQVRSAAKTALPPQHVQPQRLAPRTPLPRNESEPRTALETQRAVTKTVEIGSIDVRIVAPNPEPVPRAAVPPSRATQGSLARGFVTAYGLRQR